MLWGLKHPLKFFTISIVEAGCSCILHTFMGNEKLKITRGIVILIQEFLILVNFTVEAAKIKIL